MASMEKKNRQRGEGGKDCKEKIEVYHSMQNEIMNRIKAIEKAQDSQDPTVSLLVQVTPSDIRIRKREDSPIRPNKILVTENDGELSEGEVNTPMTHNKKKKTAPNQDRAPDYKTTTRQNP